MRFGVGWINTWDAERTQTQVLDDFVKVCVAAESTRLLVGIDHRASHAQRLEF